MLKKCSYYLKTDVMYNKLYNKYIDNSNYNIAQIQQLKDFVNYYRKEEWSLAYNSFYNFFHEICKKIFDNHTNDYTIEKIINNLKPIINDEEKMDIMKFADNRNFNSISHPSKNGIMSIKISEEELNYYINSIGNIIIKLFEIYK